MSVADAMKVENGHEVEVAIFTLRICDGVMKNLEQTRSNI